MTRRTVVLVLCDMPHEEETPGETISIVTPSATVEIDLCREHVAQVLQPVLQVGRQVRKARTRKR